MGYDAAKGLSGEDTRYACGLSASEPFKSVNERIKARRDDDGTRRANYTPRIENGNDRIVANRVNPELLFLAFVREHRVVGYFGSGSCGGGNRDIGDGGRDVTWEPAILERLARIGRE